MPTTIMIIKGTDARIELTNDRVIVHRPGILNMLKHGSNARREISLASITSVNFRSANFFKMGEMDFDYAGRSQLDRAQNTVHFTRKQQAAFEAMKEKIFELMSQRRG